MTRHEAINPARAMGPRMANTVRHPHASIIGPPTTSPITGAPVIAIWNQPMATVRRSMGKASMMRAMPFGMVEEIPIPAITRNAMKADALQARPQAIVAVVRMAAPMMNRRRWPWVSPSLPMIGVQTAMARKRPVTDQLSVAAVEPRSSAITVSEAETIVIEALKAMTPASTVISSRIG